MPRPTEPVLKPVLIPRDEFISSRWDYKPGEHVSFLAPTQAGKTTLMAQLAGVSCTPELPGVLLVMKPRDRVVDKIIKELDFQKIRTWPPKPRLFKQRPPGYALWPKQSLEDPDSDDAHLEVQFRKAILACYKHGDRIILADEVHGLVKDLNLEKPLNTVWMRGASMDCGLWGATQRPANVPLNMYSQAEHVFLSNDPDKRGRDRYGEIGGVDPKMVEATLERLPKFHWLYIRRTGRVTCVVGP